MREISHESYRPEVLTGYLAPELSRENSLAKSRASSRAKHMIVTDSSDSNVRKRIDTADLHRCRTVAQDHRWSDRDDNSDIRTPLQSWSTLRGMTHAQENFRIC